MLARLRMELDSEELNYKMSSNLQGVIYENIVSEYVGRLHENSLHPYSQCLVKENGHTVWYINTTTQEAYENIILPLQSEKFQEFTVKKHALNCKIGKKTLTTEKRADLLEEFYNKTGTRYINLDFQTPTSFKQNGRNVIFPDIRLIYQSIMNKYGHTSETVEMFDEDTLEQLVKNSEIVQYNLKSIRFPMEGIQVPAFCGRISVHMRGTDIMKRYVRLLCRFGEYSGVGTKTAMGMGAVKIMEWRQ